LMLLRPQQVGFGDQNTKFLTMSLEIMEKCVIDSGCSRHMTRNMSYLSKYEEIDGGYVAFGGDPKGELKFNLFSVLRMCDKKNSVLFTYTKCVVLSPDFKLLDESQVLLRFPRKNNMYSVDLKNVAPLRGLTCLFAKATLDESHLWRRRLGHIKFKTMNKLMRGNLTQDPLLFSSSKDPPGDGFKPSGEEEKKDVKDQGNEDYKVLSTEDPRVNQEKDANVNNTNNINIVNHEQGLNALSQANVIDTIEESIQVNMINKVKNQLPKFVPAAVSDFIKPRLKRTVLIVMKTNHIDLFKSST
nr:ribonuclease H-like domain-containing protein [Tanacetum cinerariifolium]